MWNEGKGVKVEWVWVSIGGWGMVVEWNGFEEKSAKVSKLYHIVVGPKFHRLMLPFHLSQGIRKF